MQRNLDDAARARFVARSKAVASIRNHMVEHGFLEVETPMLHPIPGGANAKPFITHHNALDQDMYLRIAPELYLKRLVVGGFERVFEINRSFRNEGISVRHNPEFTMMEFYAAYWNHHDMMDFTEGVLRHAAREIVGMLYAGVLNRLDRRDIERVGKRRAHGNRAVGKPRVVFRLVIGVGRTRRFHLHGVVHHHRARVRRARRVRANRAVDRVGNALRRREIRIAQRQAKLSRGRDIEHDLALNQRARRNASRRRHAARH